MNSCECPARAGSRSSAQFLSPAPTPAAVATREQCTASLACRSFAPPAPLRRPGRCRRLPPVPLAHVAARVFACSRAISRVLFRATTVTPHTRPRRRGCAASSLHALCPRATGSAWIALLWRERRGLGDGEGRRVRRRVLDIASSVPFPAPESLVDGPRGRARPSRSRLLTLRARLAVEGALHREQLDSVTPGVDVGRGRGPARPRACSGSMYRIFRLGRRFRLTPPRRRSG